MRMRVSHLFLVLLGCTIAACAEDADFSADLGFTETEEGIVDAGVIDASEADDVDTGVAGSPDPLDEEYGPDDVVSPPRRGFYPFHNGTEVELSYLWFANTRPRAFQAASRHS